MGCFFMILIAGLVVTGWWESQGEEILRRREIRRLVRASIKKPRRLPRRNRWGTVGRRGKPCSP